MTKQPMEIPIQTTGRELLSNGKVTQTDLCLSTRLPSKNFAIIQAIGDFGIHGGREGASFQPWEAPEACPAHSEEDRVLRGSAEGGG